jgi:Secretion system C-terminal sorting domain
MKQLCFFLLGTFVNVFFLGDIYAQTCMSRPSCNSANCCTTPTVALSCTVLNCAIGVSSQLAPCAPYYNCHQYTRASLDNNPSANSIFNPNCISGCVMCNYPSSSIIEDPAFVPVPNIGQAQAIHYSNNPEHSGVFDLGTGDPNDVISKNFPDGNLYLHHKDCFPNGYQTFLSYIGYIEANANIMTATALYVIDRPGVTYSWAAEPAGVVTFSNTNQYATTITPVCSGTVTIKLTAYSSIGSRTQCVTVTSAPSNPCSCVSTCDITGTYTPTGSGASALNSFNNTSTYATLANVTCLNATSIRWTKTSGNGTFVENNYTGSASIYLNSGQSISLNIVAKNGACTVGTRTVTFQRGGSSWRGAPKTLSEKRSMPNGEVMERDNQAESFVAEGLSLSPNPSNGEIFIYSEKVQVLHIDIFDRLGRLVISNETPTEGFRTRINLGDHSDGLYWVKIRDADDRTQVFKAIIIK